MQGVNLAVAHWWCLDRPLLLPDERGASTMKTTTVVLALAMAPAAMGFAPAMYVPAWAHNHPHDIGG